MTYRVQLSASARRAIEKELPEAVAAAVFEFLRGPLAANPQRVGKPLGGELAGRWSARRGEYRVVYRIDDDSLKVIVIRIGHRRDIYHLPTAGLVTSPAEPAGLAARRSWP